MLVDLGALWCWLDWILGVGVELRGGVGCVLSACLFLRTYVFNAKDCLCYCY